MSKTPEELAEECEAKLAVAEPRPVLDPLSVKHGRCSMMNDARKIIEETMVQLAPRFDTGHFMAYGWDNIVLFHDTLLVNLRKVDL
jgi:hypothetical protein